MSQPATEPAPSRRENVFTRHIGPLPMWQWLLIGGGLIGVYVIYSYRKNASAANAANNSAAGTSTGGTTSASQVPQFVNQTNTYVAPPIVEQPPASSHAKPPPTPAQPPAPTPTPAPITQPPAAQGTIAANAPNIRGLSLSAAISALQKAGWGISSVSYANQNLSQQQYGQYASTPVYSYTPYASSHTVSIGLQ